MRFGSIFFNIFLGILFGLYAVMVATGDVPPPRWVFVALAGAFAVECILDAYLASRGLYRGVKPRLK